MKTFAVSAKWLVQVADEYTSNVDAEAIAEDIVTDGVNFAPNRYAAGMLELEEITVESAYVAPWILDALWERR